MAFLLLFSQSILAICQFELFTLLLQHCYISECSAIMINDMDISKNNTDLWGVIASLTCAVHCVAVPALMLYVGVEGNHTHHLVFDLLMVCIGIYLIVTSLLPTIKATKNVFLITALSLGIFFFVISFFFQQSVSHILFAIGGVSWAAAHAYKLIYNSKLSRADS